MCRKRINKDPVTKIACFGKLNTSKALDQKAREVASTIKGNQVTAAESTDKLSALRFSDFILSLINLDVPFLITK